MYASANTAHFALLIPSVHNDFKVLAFAGSEDANVLGYLAGQPLINHPDIAQLLTGSTPQPPLKRLERAAELAKSRAAKPQGDRS